MSLFHWINMFMLISWKNHKSQFNRPLETMIVLLSPVFMCTLGVLMRLYYSEVIVLDKAHDPIDLNRSWWELMETLQQRVDFVATHSTTNHNAFMPRLTLAWAPSGFNIFENIMNLAIIDLAPLQLRSFATCTEMFDIIKSDSLFAGVCFDVMNFAMNYEFDGDHVMNNSHLPVHFKYSLLFPSELRIYQDSYIGHDWLTEYQDDPRISMLERLNMTGDVCSDYVQEGFLNIQKIITEKFLHVAHCPIPKIIIRQFPVVERKVDLLQERSNHTLALLIIIGFLFPAQALAWDIVKEKECHMRLYMINMNINNIIHYFAWFLKGFLYMTISSTIITIIFKFQWFVEYSVLPRTPWRIILIVLISYNLAATAFCVMVASFFKESSETIRALSILWVLTFLPSYLVWSFTDRKLMLLKEVIGIFPNSLLALIFQCFIERELTFYKAWHDEGYVINQASGRMTVYQRTIIFYILAAIFMIIGLYMEVWNTSEMSGFQRKRPKGRTSLLSSTSNLDFDYPREYAGPSERDGGDLQQNPLSHNSTKIYEVEPSNRRVKLKIKKLTKTYDESQPMALNMFSWNIYENEVTVLMGHNGSGKTTLLKILSGLMTPTRGTAVIAGHNILMGRKEASMEVGIALGDELLLSDMTVADHIQFICAIKGVDWLRSRIQVEYYIDALNITHYRNETVNSLRTRERYLLSICCAFAGDSSVVLIDDMHSDMDAQTQRLIWNLINTEKSRRTIILVSNSIPVTVMIADRVGVMASGELKCTGTKAFLLNMYGFGYHLICNKGSKFNCNEMLELLHKYLPNTYVEWDIGRKVSFLMETQYDENFVELLDELEREMIRLNIFSIRIRNSSMEEIFMSFGSDIDYLNILEFDYTDIQPTTMATGWRLFYRQFHTLLYKHRVLQWRQLASQLINLFTLIIGVFLTLSAFVLYSKNYSLSELSFNLTTLNTVDAFVEVVTQDPYTVAMSDVYTELLFWYEAKLYKVPNIAQLDEINEKAENYEDIEFYILQRNDFDHTVNFKYQFGASFHRDSMTAWFNSIPLHAAPFSLNAVHNALARQCFSSEASIDVVLLPMPFQLHVRLLAPTARTVGNLLAIALIFCFAYVWPSTIAYLIHERLSTFKHTQLLAGAHICTYWITNLVSDFLRILTASTWIVLVTMVIIYPEFDLALCFFLFVTMIIAGLMVKMTGYFLSLLCDDPNYGYILLTFGNTLGVIAFMLTFRMLISNDRRLLFLGQYAFGQAVNKLFQIFEFKRICNDPIINMMSTQVDQCESVPNCCRKMEYWGIKDGVCIELLVLFGMVVIGCLALAFAEYWALGSPACHPSSADKRRKTKDCRERDNQSNASLLQDETVIAERKLIQNMTSTELGELTAVCHCLGKSFGQRRVVKGVDFVIRKGECIGLAGLCGSGKTTIIQMLVGLIRPSFGHIWIQGKSKNHKPFKCLHLLGYSGQSVRMPGFYSLRELFRIHAQLRGCSVRESDVIGEILSKYLGFRACFDHPLSMCTKGQYRRFAFALAIFGNPALVCIDGSPGGLDPMGRRIIFNITQNMQQTAGISFVYTNLSNRDTESICQRMPILYRGYFTTICDLMDPVAGYQTNYRLVVYFKSQLPWWHRQEMSWLRDSHPAIVIYQKFKQFIEQNFPEAQLENSLTHSIVFVVPAESTSLSYLFEVIRTHTTEMNIEEFVITSNMAKTLQSELPQI